MKALANISRILVSLVFLFSGFVKGVDPLGFAYKIEDYFIAYHLDWAIPMALIIAVIMCALEFSIGVMLLLNLRMKVAAWLLLLMMMYFTGLTFYDALYNPVPDCGCFGDAIKLTNWQTFYKNIVLLVPTIIIFGYRKKYRNSVSLSLQWLVTFGFTAAMMAFSLYCYRHLPLIDFTEWKKGHKLYAENPSPVRYYLTYRNKATGEEKEYLSPNYPFNDSIWMAQWEFKSQRVDDPNTYYGKSLVITDTIGDIHTDEIIRNPGYQIIVNSASLKLTNARAFKMADDFCRAAADDGYATAAIVPDESAVIAEFARVNDLSIPFYQGDDIILKTMVRSNPGIMLLKGGVVIDKWHWRDIPDYQQFKKMFPVQ
ncbi:MAG TPA: DoxX family protein [Bacteroidales bacterium]|nr:DoxX family protein [Bacteroidales bacterium]